MIATMCRVTPAAAGAALALSLGIALAGCAGMPTNRSLESVHQPVVERTNYVLDVSTAGDGLAYAEERRLAGWFEAMDLRYGDRVAIDAPAAGPATRAAIERVAARHGILLSEVAPETAGIVPAGTARIVLTRSSAHVPGCPDWSAKSDSSLNNATSSNYGCAVNGNMAAMVADPEHLLKGAETKGNTVIMSSTKAISSYRAQAPTAEKGLAQTSSQDVGSGQ